MSEMPGTTPASPGHAAMLAHHAALDLTVLPWDEYGEWERAAWDAAANAAAGTSSFGDVPPPELAYLLKLLDCSDIGRTAYAGYCASGSGKSLISGVPLPEWEAQSAAIKRAWQAAAEFVVALIADNLSALAGERRAERDNLRTKLAEVRSVLLEGGQSAVHAISRALAIISTGETPGTASEEENHG